MFREVRHRVRHESAECRRDIVDVLYYGTADNNVHPSNSLQLIKALQQAGKGVDVQDGPDQGHSGLNQQRMMEFFIENLVINADTQDGRRKTEEGRR